MSLIDVSPAPILNSGNEKAHPNRCHFHDRLPRGSARARKPSMQLWNAYDLRFGLPDGDERHEPGLPHDGHELSQRHRLSAKLLLQSVCAGNGSAGRHAKAEAHRGYRNSGVAHDSFRA